MRVALLLAVLALSGCSLVGGDAAELQAFVSVPAAGVTVENVAITVDGELQHLMPAPAAFGGRFASEPASIGTGARSIACALSSGSDTSTVRVALDVSRGWDYEARCSVQEEDPTALCFGCSESASAPLSARLREAFTLPDGARLWLYTTGMPEGGGIHY